VNDLEPAARSLAPAIGDALDAVLDAGAAHAMVSGSGPTVFGVWWGAEAEVRATDAADALADRYPGATSATPVSEDFGAPRGS
jgi:4-diphosphocytidyl-2-C-methyl-D-erythritol kinase